MNIPSVVGNLPDNLRAALGFSGPSTHLVPAWPTPGVYPLPGFLPWSLFEVGNGDVYGYYWPIGCETARPVICTTHHDSWSLVPLAASLEGFLRIGLATGDLSPDEDEGIAEALHVDANSMPELGETDVFHTLERAPDSPRYLLAAAEQHTRNEQFAAAEELYLKVLAMIPEYGEVSFKLAKLYRRLRRTDDAIRRLLDALCAPLCFGGDRLQCLHELQRLPDTAFSEPTEPLWRHRRSLTFDTGVKTCDDFLLLPRLIEEYLEREQGVYAVRLCILCAERFERETISLRGRYGYTREGFITLLQATLRRAGLENRIPALTL